MSPRPAMVPALIIVGAAFLMAADSPTALKSMTNEDIVRLVMTGTAEEVILAAIAEHAPHYDLDSEILAELRRVGVSPAIIAAMRRRQEALLRSRPPDATPVPDSPLGILEIAFQEDDAETSVRSPFAITSLPRGMQRPPGVEVGLVSDLALVVLCTTTDHVPDYWDTLSPLEGSPRHRLIAFNPGSSPGELKGFAVISLSHVPLETIPIAVGAHSLVVALAGKGSGSGSWRLLASDITNVVIDEHDPTRLLLRARTRILGNRMVGMRIEQEWDVSEPVAAGGE